MKPRNYVAKNAQINRGGAHKPKKGQKASRCRQKREWKKEL